MAKKKQRRLSVPDDVTPALYDKLTSNRKGRRALEKKLKKRKKKK